MSATAAGARPARHPSRASALAWPSKPSDGSDTTGQDAWNGPTKPSPSSARPPERHQVTVPARILRSGRLDRRQQMRPDHVAVFHRAIASQHGTRKLTIIVDYDADRREARYDVAEHHSRAGPARLRAHRRDGPRDDLQPGPAPGLTRAEHHQAVPRAWPVPGRPADGRCACWRTKACCTASPGSVIT